MKFLRFLLVFSVLLLSVSANGSGSFAPQIDTQSAMLLAKAAFTDVCASIQTTYTSHNIKADCALGRTENTALCAPERMQKYESYGKLVCRAGTARAGMDSFAESQEGVKRFEIGFNTGLSVVANSAGDAECASVDPRAEKWFGSAVVDSMDLLVLIETTVAMKNIADVAESLKMLLSSLENDKSRAAVWLYSLPTGIRKFSGDNWIVLSKENVEMLRNKLDELKETRLDDGIVGGVYFADVFSKGIEFVANGTGCQSTIAVFSASINDDDEGEAEIEMVREKYPDADISTFFVSYGDEDDVEEFQQAASCLFRGTQITMEEREEEYERIVAAFFEFFATRLPTDEILWSKGEDNTLVATRMCRWELTYPPKFFGVMRVEIEGITDPESITESALECTKLDSENSVLNNVRWDYSCQAEGSKVVLLLVFFGIILVVGASLGVLLAMLLYDYCHPSFTQQMAQSTAVSTSLMRELLGEMDKESGFDHPDLGKELKWNKDVSTELIAQIKSEQRPRLPLADSMDFEFIDPPPETEEVVEVVVEKKNKKKKKKKSAKKDD